MKKLLIAGLMALTAGSASASDLKKAGRLIIQNNASADLYFNVVDINGASQEHFTLSFLHRGWTDGNGRREFSGRNGTDHVDLIPVCAGIYGVSPIPVPERGITTVTVQGACGSISYEYK